MSCGESAARVTRAPEAGVATPSAAVREGWPAATGRWSLSLFGMLGDDSVQAPRKKHAMTSRAKEVRDLTS